MIFSPHDSKASYNIRLADIFSDNSTEIKTMLVFMKKKDDSDPSRRMDSANNNVLKLVQKYNICNL